MKAFILTMGSLVLFTGCIHHIPVAHHPGRTIIVKKRGHHHHHHRRRSTRVRVIR